MQSLVVVMAAKNKWEAVKERVTGGPAHDPDAALEANLENADPELCIRLLQVGRLHLYHGVNTYGSPTLTKPIIKTSPSSGRFPRW